MLQPNRETRIETEYRKIGKITRYLQQDIPQDRRVQAEKQLTKILFKSEDINKEVAKQLFDSFVVDGILKDFKQQQKGNIGISKTGKLFRKNNSWKPKKQNVVRRKRKFRTVFGQVYFV